MNILTGTKQLAVIILGTVQAVAAFGAEPLYQTRFEKTEVGQVPDDLLILDGQFAVREHEGKMVLELPGAPLESFGFLMGPAQKEGLTVFGRIQGTSRGRKSPAFAVSLNGASGYRLQVAPAKKSVEILKGDLPLVAAPFEWKSGVWTSLRLQVRKVEDGLWRVEGKVWLEGQPEPEDWSITWDEKQEPIVGRPGAWGSPFSGTPIWYDNLVVTLEGESR
jgi:hypothetical protein